MTETELYIESLVSEYNSNRELKARVLTKLWETMFIRNYVNDEPEDDNVYEPEYGMNLDYCAECSIPLANIPVNEIVTEYHCGIRYKRCSWKCR